MLELRGIETFYWVATLGGFRAAADKLHASQPAISQRIQQLEDALGVRLFDRDTRGVRLTAKGQALLAHAERMLQLRHDMLLVARERNAIRGRVSIGVSETIVQTWLPALLERVNLNFPDLVVEVEVDTTPVLRANLLARQIDLAFLMGPLNEPRVENLFLCRYPLAWVASPRLELGPEPVPLARVARWPIITYPSNSRPYQVVRAMLAEHGVESPRMVGSASLGMAVRLTLDGMGTSVIAPVFLGKELAEGRLVLVQVDAGPLPDLEFTATWLQGTDSHAAAAVARLAVQVAAEEARPVPAS
jgi:DNA-binding transcriptional LysR family regulator